MRFDWFQKNIIQDKTRKPVFWVFVFTLVLSGLIYILDQNSGLPLNEDGRAYLERNSYGEGSRSERLTVEGSELGEGVVEFEVGELEYTQEEIQSVLEDAAVMLETLILAENESLERVQSDLNLISQIPDTGIDVNWEVSDYTLMDITGKLNAEAIKDGGTIAELTAILTYQSRSLRHTFPVCIYPPEMSKEEKRLSELTEIVQNQENESRDQEKVFLPEDFNGEKVTWAREQEQRWGTVLILGAASTLLLFFREKEAAKKSAEERRKQMMLDYPGIVNKLTIYTGAGMTIRNAWGKVVQDYENNQQAKEIRHAYEEMRVTWHELSEGVGEKDCYERFGSRCNLQAYTKLGALLAQNLRKGTKGLSDLLRVEAMNAFEERKALARKQGEEAGTKLLVPMFLMLAIVLVIVIVPAFLSIQF